MASPSITYTFSNGTLSDATQVNTNFTNLIDGATDGTKDYSINALTCAGVATLNGNVILGSASGDDLTVNASLASSIVIKTDATYSIGSTTAALVAVYLNNSATDSGSIYFDLSTSKYIKGAADATNLTVSGMGIFRANAMAIEVYNSTTKYKVNSSGVLLYGGATTSGWTSNLGIKYTVGTGVFEMVGYDGTALSTSNPAFITVPSKTAGRQVSFIVTSGPGFIDDNGSSEIIGNLFGATTGVAWAVDCPFYIYACIDDGETTVSFALSRAPHMTAVPAAADIGFPGTAAADNEYSMFFFDSVTATDYNGNPCVCIGSIRMRMSASDDWTVQTLSDSRDGIGRFQEGFLFSYPKGHGGAAASTHTLANGGTSATFTTSTINYTISRDGFITVMAAIYTDAGTDGSGGAAATFALPFYPDATANTGSGIGPVGTICGSGFYHAAGAAGALCLFEVNTGISTRSWAIRKATYTAVTWGDFTNGVRAIDGQFTYLAETSL